MGMRQRRGMEGGTEVQSIIFDKSVFRSAERARQWLQDHDFSSGKLDETEESFRFRQKDPGEFREGSFRTIEMTEGIKAVIGRPKRS